MFWSWMQLKVYLHQRFFTFPTSAFPRLITFTRRDFLSRLLGAVVSICTRLAGAFVRARRQQLQLARSYSHERAVQRAAWKRTPRQVYFITPGSSIVNYNVFRTVSQPANPIAHILNTSSWWRWRQSGATLHPAGAEVILQPNLLIYCIYIYIDWNLLDFFIFGWH